MTTDEQSDSGNTPGDASVGFALVIAAYGLWGVIPLYFRQVRSVAPLEVLAHRVWWSFVALAVVVVVARRGPAVVAVLKNRRTAAVLAGSAVLIAVNWFTYIYAVSHEQVVQAGLGYFTTPLANVALGVVVLGERLRWPQTAAIALAAAGIVVLTAQTGRVPWISLTLAVSFSSYGLFRKLATADALVGLFVETLLLTPVALAYLGYLAATADGGFSMSSSLRIAWLLVAGGPVTTVPLLCFAGAARRLRLTTLGFLQFITPTMQVLVAVCVFQEPFTKAHRYALPLIGAAVAVYLFDALGTRRENRFIDSRD